MAVYVKGGYEMLYYLYYHIKQCNWMFALFFLLMLFVAKYKLANRITEPAIKESEGKKNKAWFIRSGRNIDIIATIGLVIACPLVPITVRCIEQLGLSCELIDDGIPCITILKKYFLEEDYFLSEEFKHIIILIIIATIIVILPTKLYRFLKKPLQRLRVKINEMLGIYISNEDECPAGNCEKCSYCEDYKSKEGVYDE